MGLTKKQKRYIEQHIRNKSVQEISRHLNVTAAVVESTCKSMNLSTSGKYDSGKGAKSNGVWRRPYFFPLTFLGFAVIIGILCYDPKLYISGDNVEFMDLGTSIREGRGMMELTKYTFLFPLFLAFVQAVSNNSLQVQKILVLVFYIASAPFLFWIFRRQVGDMWAAVAAVFGIMNVFLIEFSHIVMSEIPYLFFSVLAIAAFDRAVDRGGRMKDLAVALLAVVTVYYVRPAGMAMFAGVVCYFLLMKRWKMAAITAGIFFLAVLPWNIRNQLLAGGSDYAKVIFLKNPYNPALGSVNFSEFIERIWHNLMLYSTQEIPYVLFPFRFRTTMVHPPYFPQGIGVLLTGLGFAGFIWYVLKHRNLLSLYMVFYIGIVLVLQPVWSGSRFIIPVMPFLIFFLIYLIYQIIEKARQTQMGFAVRVAGILLVAVIGFLHVRNVWAWESYMGKYPPAWESYFKAAEWVRENTQEDAVICDRKAGLFRIIAERKGVGTPGSSFGNDHLAHLKFFYERNVDYVIIPSIPYPDIGRYLWPAVQAYPDRFTLAYKLDNPITLVVQLDRTVPLPEN